MPKYFTVMHDGSDVIIYYKANNNNNAVKSTEQWILEAYIEYEDDDSTTWFDYAIYKVPLKHNLHDEATWDIESDKNLVVKGTVPIHPKEPICLNGSKSGHKWTSDVITDGGRHDNPGVFINGRGVIVVQHCILCSMTKIVDTNAYREDTNEGGLNAITYGKLDTQNNLWVK